MGEGLKAGKHDGETFTQLAKDIPLGRESLRKLDRIKSEAKKGNPVAIEEREKLLSGESTSINRAYNMVTGHEEKPRKCSICGKPIASGKHYQDKRNWCYECGLAHAIETQREYRDAEKSLRENKPVYNRASLIAEWNGSAKMLEESWKQSLEINESQGVKLTKDEKNGIYSAIDRLYTAIEKIKEEG